MSQLSKRAAWATVFSLAGLSLSLVWISAMIFREPQANALTWLDTSQSIDTNIFWKLQLPRAFGAFVVGMSLAVAGVVYQAVLVNPLAGPYTLGASTGSALSIIVALYLGVAESLSGLGFGAISLFGALLATFIIWRIARHLGGFGPIHLILAGIVLSLLCSSAIVLLQFLANTNDLAQMVHWLMGSLDWVPKTLLIVMSCVAGCSFTLAMAWHRELDALTMGPDRATSVGVSARGATIRLLIVAGILVGAAVAIAGPIAFIGLIIPHLVRPFVGAQHKQLLALAAVAGGLLLLVCDFIARVSMIGGLPVGVITGILGAVFFLILLSRGISRGWS